MSAEIVESKPAKLPEDVELQAVQLKAEDFIVDVSLFVCLLFVCLFKKPNLIYYKKAN